MYWGFTNGFFSGPRSPKFVALADCLSNRIKTDQAIAMVDRYYKNNPERLGIWILTARLEAAGPATISGMRMTSLCVVTLLAFSISPAWSRNLSSMDGNVLLTKCHPALQMNDVSPKLSQAEWAAAFYCLGFVQGAMDADSVWQIDQTQALAHGIKTRSIILL